MALDSIAIRVLLFRDPEDHTTWIAHGLEYNIAAHGPDVEAAKRAFERTVDGYVQMALKYQLAPLASVGQAPRMFFDVWERLVQQTVAVERIPSVPVYLFPVVTDEPLQTRLKA